MRAFLVTWSLALSVVAAVASAASSPADTTPLSLTNPRGLAFTDEVSFCRYHCRRTHLSNARVERRLAACDIDRCAPFIRRMLAERGSDEEDLQEIDFASCKGVAKAPATLAFHFKDVNHTSVFQGFHEAFVAAFDAMVSAENATYDACQLVFLQDKLIQSDSGESGTLTEGRQPMMVRFRLLTKAEEVSCMHQVKQLWPEEKEHRTPLLSRRDLAKASATVLLMHVTQQVASEIKALNCIEDVVQLPVILKLMPFARSLFQLSQRPTTEAPALEIRLASGASRDEIHTHMQDVIREKTGVTNALDDVDERVVHPRSLISKSMEELSTWLTVLSVIVSDEQVEWVDVHTSVIASSMNMRTSVVDDSRQVHRRLDVYAPPLVGVEPAWRMGIRGNGVIVGVTDSGLYIDHDQFDQKSRSIYGSTDMSARKVVLYNPWASSYDEGESVTCGHGTHVAGILAGSSFSGSNRNLGIADQARIAFMDIGAQSRSCMGNPGCPVQLATPGNAQELLQSQIDAGARIFSFSWGTPGSDYSSQARDIDAYVYENPEILIIVAAGNEGDSTSTGKGTISSPSGAKNVISVGASMNSPESLPFRCDGVFNEFSVASFSSAGPTSDGRMKPDVVAPGMMIESSKSERPGSTVKTSETCSLQGTSQATPVVTGLAVLLYEWLRDGWWKHGVKDAEYGMKSVPAALLKALLIHSGESLRKRIAPLPRSSFTCSTVENMAIPLTYPDMYQGYGKPNISRIIDGVENKEGPLSLYFLPNSSADSEPRVAHEGEVVISFTVPKGIDLRATVVWTDPAGSVQSSVQLQHDLDLTVRVGNSSKKFYPLSADGTTKRDDRNNVEMVHVSYQELLDAVNAEPNAADLIGPSGEIVVDAVIYGRSVLLSDSQAFAFVASSSSIGTTSGVAPPSQQRRSIFFDENGFWTPWTIGGIVAAALIFLLLALMCCGCRSKSTASRSREFPATAGAPPHQSRPAGAYRAHHTPTHMAEVHRCPYCAFSHPDAVIMVNHVEAMHGEHTGSIPIMNLAQNPSPAPILSAPPVRSQPSQEYRCPQCNFSSRDAVIMVNHVEHMHSQV